MKSLPDKLSRYAAVATLFLKYGRSNVGATTPGALTTDVPQPDDDGEAPEQLARDLEALFGNRIVEPTPVKQLGSGHLFLKRSFYSLDLRIVQTKPGAQPDSMFDETKAIK